MASKPSILAASISPQPVGVEAVGRSFVIPVRTASEWITAVAQDDFVTAVFPGLLPPDGVSTIVEMLIEGYLEPDELKRPAFDAITAASGFRWWEAMRLVGMADGNQQVIGELTLRGVDPDTIPFGRWCAALYALAVRGMDEKERQKWLAKFTMPPPEAMDEAAETDGFQDMIKGFRGMAGVRGG